jgi:hypothetical protein
MWMDNFFIDRWWFMDGFMSDDGGLGGLVGCRFDCFYIFWH